VSRKKSLILTDHELRLMEVLWRSGSATVADVVDVLPPPPLAYRPLVARDEAAKSAMRHLLDRFFGSSPGALAVTLLDDTRLSDDDIAKIKRMLARNRKGSQ
jgi:predicted transcriptional regulator